MPCGCTNEIFVHALCILCYYRCSEAISQCALGGSWFGFCLHEWDDALSSSKRFARRRLRWAKSWLSMAPIPT